MKIKYRRFDDVEFKEIECIDFDFYIEPYINKKETALDWKEEDGGIIYTVFNVCEVYIEEI